MTTDEIQTTVKQYILAEFLPGQDPAELTAELPLITGKILDSIEVLKLVSFLEGEFGIQLEAHEVDFDHLDTIASIAELVESKLRSSPA
jgi:acyl carrier protein